jgi:hypothetical protein
MRDRIIHEWVAQLGQLSGRRSASQIRSSPILSAGAENGLPLTQREISFSLESAITCTRRG